MFYKGFNFKVLSLLLLVFLVLCIILILNVKALVSLGWGGVWVHLLRKVTKTECAGESS